MYPLLILVYGIILCTRNYEPTEENLVNLPFDEVDPIMNVDSSSTAIRNQSYYNAPSVIESVTSYQRNNLNQLNSRPSSTMESSSINNRLPMLKNPRSFPNKRLQNQSFAASSPIPEFEDDLWDSASLDYPGREVDTPHDWNFMIEKDVHFSSWTLWLLGLFVLLSLAFGIPATLMMERFPKERPGCNIPVRPFSAPYSVVVLDTGFNFQLSFIVICYFIALISLLLIITVIFTKRLANKLFLNSVKILVGLTLVFAISRSPVDIIQIKSIIDAVQGYSQIDEMDIEIDIIFVWTTFLPVLLNPIVYFSFMKDYRLGALNALKRIFGINRQNSIIENYEPKEEPESKTQESTIL